MKTTSRTGFTIIELLVVVSIIALLVGILLPAIGSARDQARVSISATNLRNLATAHGSYAAEFSDRQFTLVDDNIATYGGGLSAFEAYFEAHGGNGLESTHPGPILGWAYNEGQLDQYVLFGYWTHEDDMEGFGGFNGANAALNLPISFSGTNQYFGSFRLPNVKQFNQYVGGKFYDKVFYAPNDKLILAEIESASFGGGSCFDEPGEYCDRPDIDGQGEIPVWSSYCLSPAGMLSADVMHHDDPDVDDDGWKDPWGRPAGWRSPGMSQALYPNLKTHMLEHHWLQNVQAECNASFTGGSYDGCEPHYFNHGWESSPMTLFYDGHVGGVGVRKAMRADGRMRAQTGSGDWGLWSHDTPMGVDGYFIQEGYDQAASSFHILTTDGIRGRDVLGN